MSAFDYILYEVSERLHTGWSMHIRNPRDFGLLLRQARRDHGWSQQELAEKIGASRHWVIDVERGKSTAEMGLVLKALSALGMTCDVRSTGPRGLHGSVHTVRPTSPDLESVLVQASGRRIVSMKNTRSLLGGGKSARPDSPGVPVPDLERVLTETTGKRTGTVRFSPAGEDALSVEEQ